MNRFLVILSILSLVCNNYDVVVIGGGTSGVCAGIAASRNGARTLIVEETPWLGGMLTSAGVSAFDGNRRLQGGLFAEFVDSLENRYGGVDKLHTGWVSAIMFRPDTGEQIFENMAARESLLDIRKKLTFKKIRQTSKGWSIVLSDGSRIRARILIDGTELGDVAKECGAEYRIGEDARSLTGERIAHEQANDIIQDMTYILTVRDFGPDSDMTIPEPSGYRRDDYVNCCVNPLNTPVFKKGQTLWSPQMMMSYGLLPGGSIMLNWPIEGNDYYANVIDASPRERADAFQKAKDKALGYLYFIQTELSMKNIGIDESIYPSQDHLPFFPYHRESRRIRGLALFTADDAEKPYRNNLYRTGIAVGDYPVDHHHFQHPNWDELPKFFFSPIPSFTVPLGSLLPEGVDNLIVAEKSISVSNIINGATRLQPVVMEIGQAAGTLAAIAVKEKTTPANVPVRSVQSALLESGAYLQPYLDSFVDWVEVAPATADAQFLAAQRIGSTGILRAQGRNVNWSDETWLRPDDTLLWNELYLETYYTCRHNDSTSPVKRNEFLKLLIDLGGDVPADIEKILESPLSITRGQAAFLIDTILSPFSLPIDHSGNLILR